MIGICIPQFAQLRREPQHSAELVSQIIKGEWLKILEQQGAWCRVRTEHGYDGWTRTGQFDQALELDLAHKKIQFHGDSISFSTHSVALKPDSDLESEGNSLPEHPVWRADVFVEQCVRFLDVPYVWGGKTPHSLDCSGLVQLAMNLVGFSFPRDAWQQAESGTLQPILPDFSNLEPGDLLFFQRDDKKVHHVAVSLGGDQYIHASEWVRVNSLDSSKPDFVQDRFDTLKHCIKIKEASLRPLCQTFRDLLKPEI